MTKDQLKQEAKQVLGGEAHKEALLEHLVDRVWDEATKRAVEVVEKFANDANHEAVETHGNEVWKDIWNRQAQQAEAIIKAIKDHE